MAEDTSNIGVVVRVRPLLGRERDKYGDKAQSLIVMNDEFPGRVVLKTKLNEPESPSYSKRHTPDKVYKFDDSIWSFDGQRCNCINNNEFYQRTGPDLLNHYYKGFNVCLLAYGQTGSGKTFTMMGEQDELGFIPLLVHDILRHKNKLLDDKVDCELRISYMEVYNESVRDLLYEGDEQVKWRVREHPVTGPYVDNLKEYPIETYEEFIKYLTLGNKNRVTASTSMNTRSSRSHAILNLFLKQTRFTSTDDKELIGMAESQIISNIKLVDLAGSERLNKTQVFGQQDRVKEGSLINKSLTVLGRCINELSKNNPSNSNNLIPYRDSILTYILKENLGGNSKTVMIFCVSPLDYEETHQTLNYATRVKQIKTKATANETIFANQNTDWETIHREDQTIVDSLKQEIKDLTERLNNHLVSSQSDTENLSKMVSYLETELDQSKFQNKYLKNKLKQSEAEIQELKYHNKYLNNLLVETLRLEHKARTEKSHIHVSQSMNHLCDQLYIHDNDILTYLEEYNPTNVL